MPYASNKQRRYMHAMKPEVAAKMDADIRQARRTKGKGKKK